MLKRLKDWFKNHKTLVAFVVTGLFVLVQVPFILNHETLNSEATAWELSKEINPGNIYDKNSAEPYPFLFEVILAPFSQNNFPVITMSIIALVFVAIAVFLFVRFAPMGFLVKLIFLLSSAFFYFNPTIARGYCLIPLSICLICLAYEKRHEKPLLYGLSLAFLAQTDFLMYGLLVVLFVGFIIEEIRSKNNAKKTFKILLLFLFPTLISIALTIPIIIGAFLNNLILNGGLFKNSEVALSLFPSFQLAFFGVNEVIVNILTIVLAIIIILGFLARNFKVTIYSIVSLGFWFFIFSVLYPNYSNLDQKSSLLVLILLAITWIFYKEKEVKNEIISKFFNLFEVVKFLKKHLKYPVVVPICILVFANIPNTFAEAFNDLNGELNNVKDVSKFINNLEGKTLIIEGDIIPYNDLFTPSVRANIENKNVSFYNALLKSYDDYGYHLSYNEASMKVFDDVAEKVDSSEITEFFENSKKEYDHIYYLTGVYIRSCDEKLYIEDYLMDYPIIRDFNNKEYLRSQLRTVLVYKIK